MSFHHRGLECKSRKSRDTWSNRQVGLGVQNVAGQRLTEFCKENSKYPFPTTQTMTVHVDITRWSTPKSDWLYFLQPKMEQIHGAIHSSQTRPGADCGSDHQLLNTRFSLKLKKVGKTTKPFRYDLNQVQVLMMIQWRWWIDSRD